MQKILTEMNVPLFSCGNSRHTFTSHQLMILLALRQYESKSYRRFVEWLEVTNVVCDRIGLSSVSHFTTLQKATARIPAKTLKKAIRKFNDMVDSGDIFGIDSTGFKSRHADEYFTIRARIRHGFTKISLCSDMSTQIISGIEIQTNRVSHDIKHIPKLVKQICNIKSIKTMVLDKGCDSEDVHEQFHARGIKSVIPVRNMTDSVSKVKGKYRRKMCKNFDKKTYSQRNKTETIFSVIKRMFGSEILSKNPEQMEKEVLFRALAYNCHRICQISDLGEVSTWPK